MLRKSQREERGKPGRRGKPGDPPLNHLNKITLEKKTKEKNH